MENDSEQLSWAGQQPPVPRCPPVPHSTSVLRASSVSASSLGFLRNLNGSSALTGNCSGRSFAEGKSMFLGRSFYPFISLPESVTGILTSTINSVELECWAFGSMAGSLPVI